MTVSGATIVIYRSTVQKNGPGSSVHGIFQAKVLEWGATAFVRVFQRKGIGKYKHFLRIH